MSESNGTAGDEDLALALLLNHMYSRMDMARLLNPDSRTDVYAEAGWPKRPSIQLYTDLHARDPIMNRVNEYFPKECFRVQPEVYEDEDPDVFTDFEVDLANIAKTLRGEESWLQTGDNHPLWEYAMMGDIASRVTQYGVVLYGINDGRRLSDPVAGWEEKGSDSKPPVDGRLPEPSYNADYTLNIRLPEGKRKRELKYVRVFPEALATVASYEMNEASPRFGQPTTYNLTFHQTQTGLDSSLNPLFTTKAVHWSRCVHLAETAGSNDVYAPPAGEAVLNNILALQKLYAASAQGYWQNAVGALSIETQPGMGAIPIDTMGIRQMLEKFRNGQQKELIMRNLTAKPLSLSIADPTPYIASQIEAICIKLGVPVPVFKGYEIGEQASTNNERDWNVRVKQRQHGYLTHRVISRMIDRLILLGVLSKPKTYCVHWPDITTRTREQQVDLAAKIITALKDAIAGNVTSIVPEMPLLVDIMGFSDEEAGSYLEQAEEQEAEEPEEEPEEEPADTENAFCKTGEGGGVDPHCSPHSAGGHVGSGAHIAKRLLAGGVPLSKVQVKKIEHLNPTGTLGGSFTLPKSLKKHKEAIGKILPEGAKFANTSGLLKKAAAAPASAPSVQKLKATGDTAHMSSGKALAEHIDKKIAGLVPKEMKQVEAWNPKGTTAGHVYLPRDLSVAPNSLKHNLPAGTTFSFHETLPATKAAQAAKASGKLSTGEGLKGALKGAGLTKVQLEKIAVFNPQGTSGGHIKVPKATSDAAIAKIKEATGVQHVTKVKSTNWKMLAKQNAELGASISGAQDGVGVQDHAFGTKKTSKSGAKPSFTKEDVTGTTGKFKLSVSPNQNHQAQIAWKAGLTKEERYAIGSWSGSSAAIRKDVAAGTDNSGHAKSMMSSLEKGVKFEGTVHRGIKTYGDDSYGHKQIQAIAAAGVGGHWIDDAPHSTSRKPDKALQFAGASTKTHSGLLLTIESKTGRMIETESSFGTTEAEVVGMPKTKYRIKEIHKNAVVNGGKVKMWVKLEEV